MGLICVLSLKQEWEQLIYSANINIHMYRERLILSKTSAQMQEYYFQIKLSLEYGPKKKKQIKLYVSNEVQETVLYHE